MKTMLLILSALCSIFPSFMIAQTPVQQDTLAQGEEMKIIRPSYETKSKDSSIIIIMDSTNHTRTPSEIIIFGKDMYKQGINSKHEYVSHFKRQRSKFKGHWTGFNYGLVNFTGNDYSIYPTEYNDFMELDWSSSFAMQFNLFSHSINFCQANNFGILTGLGLEYQRLRFENEKSSITTASGKVIPIDLSSLNATDIKRSSLKNLYLTIPLLMEFQFPANTRKRLYISGGVMGGIRLHSKAKVVYRNSDGEKGKKKDSDDFYILPFKADVVGRIGYQRLNVWGSYTLTHMFKSGNGPALHPYIIGIGLTI